MIPLEKYVQYVLMFYVILNNTELQVEDLLKISNKLHLKKAKLRYGPGIFLFDLDRERFDTNIS